MSACPWCGYGNGGHEPMCMGGQEVAREASLRALRSAPLGDLQWHVLTRLRMHPDGLIEEEIRIECEANPNSVRGRLIELERMGLVARMGRTRLTSTGRRAQVWVSFSKTPNADP